MEFEPNKFSPKLIFLLTVIVFVAINLLGLRIPISKVSNSLFTPIMFISSGVGNGIKSSYGAIGSINTVINERNDLLIENAKLHADNSLVLLLKDRVDILESELNLSKKGSRAIDLNVVNGGDENLSDLLIVNGGDDVNVQKGDIATIGNIYIGIVESVNPSTSRILLPTYGKSYLQIAIIPAIVDISKLSVDDIEGVVFGKSTKIWSGVAIGTTNGIVVENIEKNASVKIGDHVVVNDSDVGGLYYLGDLSKITVDPTEVQITANVGLPLNYRNITNLMIIQNIE